MHTRTRKREAPKFLNKLFYSFLGLVLAVTVLLASVLLTSYFSSVDEMTNKFIATLLEQSNYSITYMNDLSQQMASSLRYDEEVIAFLNLEKMDQIQMVKTHQTVREIYLSHSYVESVYLYNGSMDLILDTKYGYQTSLEEFADQEVSAVLANAKDEKISPFVHSVQRNKQTVPVYSYVVPNFDQEGSLHSALVINISVDVLTQSLQEINAASSGARFAVASADGTLLLHPSFQDQQEITDLCQLVRQTVSSGAPEPERTVTLGGTKYILAYSNLNSNGWYLYGLVPYRVVLNGVIKTTLWTLAFTLALMIAGGYLALRMARRLNKPVETIHKIAKGDTPTEKTGLEVQEFKAIADAFTQMQKTDKENTTYRKKTSKIVKKEFLEHLFCGTAVYSSEEAQAHIAAFGCNYLLEKPCVMCLFSIDNYAAFSRANNPRERSALRFAIVNLATELLEQHFNCEMVPHGSSKFVAVVGCDENMPATKVRETLEDSLGQIQEIIKTHLEFSLTVAHGSLFRGIDHLPRMYENLEELLLLRVHHGYGKILGPHMAEDLSLDDFHVSSVSEDALVGSVVAGNLDQAQLQFEMIAHDLFQYSYNKIMLYLTHLSYRLLSSAQEEYPNASPQITEAFKNVISRLPQCEIEADFRRCFAVYLEQICTLMAAQKEAQENPSTNVLIGRVLSMIDSGFQNPELCLSSIADDLGLSTHYIGQMFRIDQGKSVSQYILDLRLEKIAQAMRETSRPFSELMEEVGFEEKQKNYIYTLFKKHFGVTVKNYRAQFIQES